MESPNIKLSLIEWLLERRNNCLRIAETKSGDELRGWVEDANYFQQAIDSAQFAEDAARGDQMWRI